MSLSAIVNSQPFLRARDEGLGDYYHGQSTSYRNVKTGYLVKYEQKLVCLWSNTGAKFDPEEWKTFKPETVLFVDDNFKIVEPDIPVQQFQDIQISSRPTQPSSTQMPSESPVKKHKVDNETDNIDPPLLGSKAPLATSNEVLTESEQLTNYIVAKTVELTAQDRKIDEEQSAIQEYYVKEISKTVDNAHENGVITVEPKEPQPKKQKATAKGVKKKKALPKRRNSSKKGNRNKK